MRFFRKKTGPGKFGRDESGTAAVEFALIFPVLVFGYLGAIAAFEAYRAQNSVTRASAAVVDLVTRQLVFSEGNRDRVFSVANAIVGDVADGDVVVTVTSVYNPLSDGEDDDYFVDWSYTSGSGAVVEDDDITSMDLPSIENGDSLVVVTVEAIYTPRFLSDIFTTMTLNYTSVRRPRFALRIPTTIDD